MYGLEFNLNEKSSLFIYERDDELEDVLIDYGLWPDYSSDYEENYYDDEDEEDEDDYVPPTPVVIERPKIDPEEALKSYKEIVDDPEVEIWEGLYDIIKEKKEYQDVDYLPEEGRKEILLGDYLKYYYKTWVEDLYKRTIMCEYDFREEIYPVLFRKDKEHKALTKFNDYKYSGDETAFYTRQVTMDEFVDNLQKVKNDRDEWYIPRDF